MYMTIQCRDNIIGSKEDVDGVENNGPIGAVIWGKAIKGVGQTFNDANHFRKVHHTNENSSMSEMMATR